MKAKISDVIIVGGGVSGLSAAHHLRENGIKEIKVISEDIGGRILTSKDGNIQYGAYYVMNIYDHIKYFSKLGRRIKLSTQILHKKDKGYRLYTIKNIKYLGQFIKFVFLLGKFKRHYKRFKKECLFQSQAQVIKSNPYLLELYNKNAFKYAEEQGVRDFSIKFAEEALHATTFAEVKHLNAFTYLQFCLPIITPVYEFIFLKDKIIGNFKNKIIIDSVESIKKSKVFIMLKPLREYMKLETL